MHETHFIYPINADVPKDAPRPDWGLLPPDDWAGFGAGRRYILHEDWFHCDTGNRPEGPYLPWRRDEIERFAAAAHAQGGQVALYVSPYHRAKRVTAEGMVQTCLDLLSMGVDGWYFDYLMPDREASKQLIAAIRDAAGPDALMIGHVSHVTPEFTYPIWPEIEEILTTVADGERVPWDAGWCDRMRQHRRGWICHAGPLVSVESNQKAFKQAGRTGSPIPTEPLSDENLAVLVAGLGGVIPGWVYAIPEGKGYRWATGESERVQAWRRAMKGD